MTSSSFNRSRIAPGPAAALPMAVLLLLAAATSAAAQPPYPPVMEGTTSEVYRTVDEVELNIYLCNPEGHSADDKRPAIVFFFGGGWRAGSPQQFLPHCRYLADRGMVGAVADYRVASRHGVTADACVEDAKSAVRWLRTNAARLGIDPDRIGAGGGSAGGHLAAATATLPGHDPDPDGPSPVPNALVLFNPATVLTSALAERLGAPAESMSPYDHLRPGLPPTILFHGTADATVAYSTAVQFCDGLRAHDARCDLVSYAGADHGFFNFGRGEGEDRNSMYEDTVNRMDGFLYSLEWLDPRPHPDGTPRKRLTWEEALANALANSGGAPLGGAEGDGAAAEEEPPGEGEPEEAELEGAEAEEAPPGDTPPDGARSDGARSEGAEAEEPGAGGAEAE